MQSLLSLYILKNYTNHQNFDLPSQSSPTSPLTPQLSPSPENNSIPDATPTSQSHFSDPPASQTNIKPASCHPMVTTSKNGIFTPEPFPNMLLVCEQTTESTTD